MKESIMSIHLTRRHFFSATAATTAGGWAASAFGIADTQPAAVPAHFPQTDPELAQSIVGKSHFDIDAVRDLLREDPNLAIASWDWGFGDWESALGAASHVGRREIVELLMAHGARPNIFTLAMMDKVDAVRGICEALPGIQKTCGPHGITLLDHAVFGRAERVREYLTKLGGAGEGQPSLPFEESQFRTYVGTYRADGLEQALLVIPHPRKGKGMGLKLEGGVLRVLNRTGDHVFSPAGASHVTVRFGVSGNRAEGLTIHRKKPMLSARRVGD